MLGDSGHKTQDRDSFLPVLSLDNTGVPRGGKCNAYNKAAC